MAEFRLETARVVLREWREEDLLPLGRMNSDPEVMDFIGLPQSRRQNSALIERFVASQAARGHCYWPIERRSDGMMIGFCGLESGGSGMPVEGKIEIGWRLARDAWGQGFALEAAQACMGWGFGNIAIDAIWAKTVPANVRSLDLMIRLGMAYVEGADFDHPALPEGDPLRRHVLYRIDRPA